MTSGDWTREFYIAPIGLPGGGKLVTLADARDFILALPKASQNSEPFQRATALLLKAAEREVAWVWLAEMALRTAIDGATEPPIGKEPRTRKRDAWRGRRQ